MTPRDKAEQLVKMFSTVGLQQRNEGIACALICCTVAEDAEINAINKCEFEKKGDKFLVSASPYWIAVRKEIEKL